MSPLSTKNALELLADLPRPMTYEDLDEVFTAFKFCGSFELPNTTWYHHEDYPDCGRFPANPRYEFSVLSDEQRGIVGSMIRCVELRKQLEAQQ